MALLDKLAAALHAPVRSIAVTPSEYLATNAELKEMLARRITPEMEAVGYTYNGACTWCGPWEDHGRRVVEARLVKGAGACFVWGRCFDFLPVLSGNLRSLRYMRTDKTVGRQLMGPSRTWDETFSLLTGGPERLEAERQRDNPYSSWPAPNYVRAFLLAALGRKQEAEAGMEAELDRMAAGSGPEPPPEVRAKLLSKLRELEVE